MSDDSFILFQAPDFEGVAWQIAETLGIAPERLVALAGDAEASALRGRLDGLVAAGCRRAILLVPAAIRAGCEQALAACGAEATGYLDPQATIAPSAAIADTAVIMEKAAIAGRARVGPGALVDAFAIIGFGTEVGAASWVGAAATLGASVRVGKGCRIGSGATLSDGISLGDGAMVGPATALAHAIPAGAKVDAMRSRPLTKTTDEIDGSLSVSPYRPIGGDILLDDEMKVQMTRKYYEP